MKRTFYWLLIVVAIFSMALIGVSCKEEAASTETAKEEAASTEEAKEEETMEEKESGGRKIGVVIITATNEHCLSNGQGAIDVIESHGDTAVLLDAKFDPAVEVELLENLIQQHVDGIALEVTGQASSLSALKHAKEEGIPVAANDQWLAPESADLVISQVATDNYMAGAMCGMDMVNRLKVKGEIAGNIMVIGVAGGDASNNRIQGFLDVVAKYPDLKVVATDYGDGTIEKSQKVTENIMQAHSDLICVFGGNDPSAIGALTAFKAAGKNEGVMFYGVDALPQALEFIKSGEMTATCKQYAYEMGQISAENIYKELNGEEIEVKLLYLPVQMISSINVDKFLSE